MKYALAFAGLVAGALAGGECYAPAPASTYNAPQPSTTATPGSDYFVVTSSRSTSPIHLLPVNARGGKFYIGAGPPSSYCPAETIGAANCPPGNETVFAGGDKTLSLGVVVPGGEQVYVAADGALSYTQAHSAYIPDGSVTDQFSITPGTNGNILGTLNFETGFVACPVGGTGTGYQVYGQVQGFEASSECLSFTALTGKSILQSSNCKTLMHCSLGRSARCVAVLDALELARRPLEPLGIKCIMTNVIGGLARRLWSRLTYLMAIERCYATAGLLHVQSLQLV